MGLIVCPGCKYGETEDKGSVFIRPETITVDGPGLQKTIIQAELRDFNYRCLRCGMEFSLRLTSLSSDMNVRGLK